MMCTVLVIIAFAAGVFFGVWCGVLSMRSSSNED